MPFLLPADTIRRLNDALVPAGLATPDARDELLHGIHPAFVASLPRRSSPLDQVQSDLAQMNQLPALAYVRGRFAAVDAPATIDGVNVCLKSWTSRFGNDTSQVFEVNVT